MLSISLTQAERRASMSLRLTAASSGWRSGVWAGVGPEPVVGSVVLTWRVLGMCSRGRGGPHPHYSILLGEWEGVGDTRDPGGEVASPLCREGSAGRSGIRANFPNFPFSPFSGVLTREK